MMFVSEAAMLLWFDVSPETIVEHDAWHTREHFPERVAIPGFRRATRWVGDGDGPRYLVCYEVDDVETLSSPGYLARLNDPTPWTQRMMLAYRGMTRAFLALRRVDGDVLGGTMISVRVEPAADRETAARDWLTERLMPALRDMPGVTGAAFLEATRQPEMTSEQRIRGQDATARWVLLVSLYDVTVADALVTGALAPARLEAAGLTGTPRIGVYRLACLSTSAT